MSLVGNKCEPQPCENGAKCIRDSKRLDGYRCKCTSDFTGRNCQGNTMIFKKILFICQDDV